MKAIHRAAIRKLGIITSQPFAIANGVSNAVMPLTTPNSLDAINVACCDPYAFGDVIAGERGTLSPVDEVESFPGLVQVDARIVHNRNLMVSGRAEPAGGV